jgi:endonuclease YncB( thermonuclease family)
MAQYDIRHSITRAPALMTLMGVPPVLAGSAVISGPATVIDGQTLEIGGQRFSFHGIAAPHLDQTCEWPGQTIPCGDVSRTALMDPVITATVNWMPVSSTSETLVTCDVHGFDVWCNMVDTGWTVTDRRVSDIYADTELRARNSSRGSCKGTFVMPWDWHAVG